jgi:signal transduction histidine kinase
MKNPNISLKWLIVITLLLLSIVLVLGFSILSVNYFFRGMDNVMAGNMEKAAKKFLQNTPKTQFEFSGVMDGYYISRDWQSMPKEYKQAFNKEPTQNGLIKKQDSSSWFKKPESIRFVMLHKANGESVFVGQRLERKNAPSVIGFNIAQSKQLLLTVSSATLLIICLLFWLLARRFTQPINALEKWTRDLTPQTLSSPAPDFTYPELNNMAQLIRNSLSSVQESLDREHDFQRHVSHELRTPVSVIRNNISLIHKLEEQGAIQNNSQVSAIVNRIDRASLTMKSLIHTLLWLSRGDTHEMLSQEKVQLDQLIVELVEENRHLLKDKAVELSVTTLPFTVNTAYEPLKIVIGNIIQNAFQHTWEGDVVIYQQKNIINVTNNNIETEHNPEELGFGLGLRLTQELVNKMQWTYHNQKQHAGHHVFLRVGEELIK